MVLERAGPHAGGFRVHAHNRGEGRRAFAVRAGSPDDGGPYVGGSWTLNQGESAWLWGRGPLVVRENADCQVLGSRAAGAGATEVEFRGSGSFEFSGPVESVEIDGSSATVRKDGKFQAVDAAPGVHRVRLVFRPSRQADLDAAARRT